MLGKRFFGAQTSIFVWEVYIFCLKCGQIFASKLTFCVCFTIHIQSEWAWEDHDAGRRTPHRIYVVVILKKANFQLFCLLPVTLWKVIILYFYRVFNTINIIRIIWIILIYFRSSIICNWTARKYTCKMRCEASLEFPDFLAQQEIKLLWRHLKTNHSTRLTVTNVTKCPAILTFKPWCKTSNRF